MRKPIISIKLSPRNYAGLAALGNGVIAGLTGNASFTTPSPALASLQTAVTNVEDAIATWGPVGNRGSKADLVDLRQKSLVLADMLKAEAQYVQNTAQAAAGTDYATMGALMVTSGFSLASVPTPQGILEKVQNFRQLVSRQLNRNEVKLRWARPLNVTSGGNVKEYVVMRSENTDFESALEVAIVTKTTFTDINTSADVKVWTYWVIARNTNGAGVTSDAITVAVLGA